MDTEKVKEHSIALKKIGIITGVILVIAFVFIGAARAITKILVPIELQIDVVDVSQQRQENLGAFEDVTITDTQVTHIPNSLEVEKDVYVNDNLLVGNGGGNVIIAKEGSFAISTSSAGLLNWAPGRKTQILGFIADLTTQTATTSWGLRCGITANDAASTTLAFDDAYASNTANLISSTVSTSSKNLFTVNASNFASVGFATTATSTSRVLCYASTSYETHWRGLCGGDNCVDTTSSPDLGRYKIFYIDSAN